MHVYNSSPHVVAYLLSPHSRPTFTSAFHICNIFTLHTRTHARTYSATMRAPSPDPEVAGGARIARVPARVQLTPHVLAAIILSTTRAALQRNAQHPKTEPPTHRTRNYRIYLRITSVRTLSRTCDTDRLRRLRGPKL